MKETNYSPQQTEQVQLDYTETESTAATVKLKTGKGKKKKPPLISNAALVSATVMISCLNIGNCFLFNIPEQLAEETMTKFDINQTKFNLMYAFYFAPSIIILIFSSKISSKLTSSLTCLFTCLIILVGSVVTNYGFFIDKFNTVLAGRFIFGIGGELLIVMAACLTEEWFKGGKLTLAVSLMEMLNLLSEGLCSYFALPISIRYSDISSPYVFGTFISLGSFLISILLFLLDRFKIRKYKSKLDNLYKKLESIESNMSQKDDSLSRITIESSILGPSEDRDSDSPSEGTSRKLSLTSDCSLALDAEDSKRSSLLGKVTTDDLDQIDELHSEIEELEDKEESEETVSFKQSIVDLLSLRTLLTMGVCAILSSCFYQFFTLFNELLIIKFGTTEEEAKNNVTILILEIIVSTPIYGLLVDKIGYKPIFLLISSILATASFVIFLLLPPLNARYIQLPIFILSQFFSNFNTVIFPTMMVSVPSRSVGICLGLSTLLESSLMTVMPILFGMMLVDKSPKSYQLSLLIYSVISSIAVLLSSILAIYDIRKDKLLSKLEDDPEVERLRRELARSKNLVKSKGSSRRKKSRARSRFSSVNTEENIGSDPDDVGKKIFEFGSGKKQTMKKRPRFMSEGVVNVSISEHNDAIGERLEEKVDKIKEELGVAVIEEDRYIDYNHDV